MSIFDPQPLPCPQCGKPVEFQVVFSVNAKRRPDLREAILAGNFQRETCPACGHVFRLEPELTYLDQDLKLWLLVRPAGQLKAWPELDGGARELFDIVFVAQVGRAARSIGKSLRLRVTFGWPALREKLLCARLGLDDVNLELLKIALARNAEDLPLADDTELRLDRAEAETLVLRWLKADTEAGIEELRVPRALYDDIAADGPGWAALRQALSVGAFVDLHRLLVAPSEGAQV